jgi:hypothetical protein
LALLGLLVALLMQQVVAADDTASAPPTPLKQLLSISWQRGPSLPRGFQDSKGGVLGGTLVSVGGFCSGRNMVPGKSDKYPRGFLKKVWALAPGDKAWVELPEFPGAARQGLDAATVADSLYCFGGFSYSEPYSYRDGYRLFRSLDRWQWDRLPDMPWPLTAHGSCVIDGKIFVVGGADYDSKKFHTATDRDGKLARLGARMLMLDTRHLDRGWLELPACPGTPRFVHAVAAVAGKVFVIGGAASGQDAAGRTYTVVDNWRYDPDTQDWQRIADSPVASGNFPAGAIVYAGRYILLVGGYAYGAVLKPDGSVAESYGGVTRHYANNAMCSDVFVFDAQAGIFGRATPLPLNNNLPMAVIEGNRLHLVGGEIGEATIDGEHFGHHPDLYLVGTISEVGR